MAKDSSWPLQQAIYDALKTDATLIALLAEGASGVYDHVPQDSDFPYVAIGESDQRPGELETKTEDGFEERVTIHTWTRTFGKNEVKNIMAAVLDALDKAALSVTGYTLVDLRFDFGTVMIEDDGVTRHGVQRFRAWTAPA